MRLLKICCSPSAIQTIVMFLKTVKMATVKYWRLSGEFDKILAELYLLLLVYIMATRRRETGNPANRSIAACRDRANTGGGIFLVKRAVGEKSEPFAKNQKDYRDCRLKAEPLSETLGG